PVIGAPRRLSPRRAVRRSVILGRLGPKTIVPGARPGTIATIIAGSSGLFLVLALRRRAGGRGAGLMRCLHRATRFRRPRLGRRMHRRTRGRMRHRRTLGVGLLMHDAAVLRASRPGLVRPRHGVAFHGPGVRPLDVALAGAHRVWRRRIALAGPHRVRRRGVALAWPRGVRRRRIALAGPRDVRRRGVALAGPRDVRRRGIALAATLLDGVSLADIRIGRVGRRHRIGLEIAWTRGRRDRRPAVIGRRAKLRIPTRRLDLAGLHRRGLNTTLLPCALLFGGGTGVDAAIAAVEADAIGAGITLEPLVIDVGDAGVADVPRGAVIREMPVLPAAAVEAAAVIAIAIIDAAIEADGRAPIAGVPSIGAV